MLIDVVIPVVSKDKGIENCIKSLERLQKVIHKVIIINQSGRELRYSSNFEILYKKSNRLSASAARNKGAELCTSKYIMFIDDDASVAEVNLHELSTILMNGSNLISLKRWDISYKKNLKPNIYNFPKFFIEWNFIVERTMFLKSGGFPNIGVGSRHRAQSGEVFILIGKLILQCDAKLCHVKSTMIEHPSLDVDLRTEKARGYLFGLGYSIGNILQYMTIIQKIYWINRLIISFLKRFTQECFFSSKSKPLNYNSVQIVIGFLSGITEAHNV